MKGNFYPTTPEVISETDFLIVVGRIIFAIMPSCRPCNIRPNVESEIESLMGPQDLEIPDLCCSLGIWTAYNPEISM